LDSSASGENTMSRPSSHHLLLARSEATVDGARAVGGLAAGRPGKERMNSAFLSRSESDGQLISCPSRLLLAAGPTVPADSILCWIKDSAEIISVIRKLLGRRKDYEAWSG